jgi:hypothetical protein
MLKEIPLLRAPENKRTGMEMSPNVKCPDQTDDAITPSFAYGFLVSADQQKYPCHSDQGGGLAIADPWRMEEPAVSRPGIGIAGIAA